jgi:hypothetical protein
MAKPPLWSGERFRQLTKKLKAKGARSPRALAAWIGRKKYGKRRFQRAAAAARKRSATSRR